MKVCVTGGSGFIGLRLVDTLTKNGYEVTVLSRQASRTGPAVHRVVLADLTSADCRLDRFVESCEIVFHCAGEVREAAQMRSLHVGGTRRLLAAVVREAAQRGQSIHWVQLSSVGAYGPPDGPVNTERVVTEMTPTRPRGEYEVTKTESDELVIQACERGLMSYSIVRPSNVFGSGMPNQSLRHLAAAVRRRLFFYVGRAGAVATYVHVDDVVEALRRCGADDRAKGRIFNVSNDCLLEEMIEGMASACGVTRPRLRLPERAVRVAAQVIGKVIEIPLTPERINALVARTRYPYLTLEHELGFTPQFSVPETVGEVVLPRS